MPTSSPHRVVVAGGGVAGLEAVLALHAQAGERVQITLLEPSIELVDRPMLVARPFAAGRAERTPIARILGPTRAIHLRESLASVDPAAKTVTTDGGEVVPYDSLVLALGARPVRAYPNATTFLPSDADALTGLLRDLEEGYSSSVAFVIPPGPTWPFPAYELAMLTAQETRGMRAGVRVVVVTPDDRPLAAFGAAASDAVAESLRDHGVEVVTGGPPLEALGVERIVALPRLEGRLVEGIPQDEHGFVRVDEHCAVLGLEAVYAAGDGVEFPVKLGGIAAEMADAAAEHIAWSAGADIEPQPFEPVLRGKLLTGDAPRSLRAAEGTSDAADHILWWPPAKVAARHLAPAIGGAHGEVMLDVEPGPDALSVRVRLDERLGRAAG
jgi:sulfide:quinone oxidoreductase